MIDILKSPEDELARLFGSSPGNNKRDSTYSSMSETSSPSVYELANTPHTSSSTPLTLTPESPDSATHLISGESSPPKGHGHGNGHGHHNNNNNNGPLHPIREPQPLQPPTKGEEHQRFNEHQLHMIHSNNRQPFFTFALKYEDDNGLIHVDFIVSTDFSYCASHVPLFCDKNILRRIFWNKFGKVKRLNKFEYFLVRNCEACHLPYKLRENPEYELKGITPWTCVKMC